MDKYKRYYGLGIFCVALIVIIGIAVALIMPKTQELSDAKANVEKKQQELDGYKSKLKVVQEKIKKIKDSIMTSQKKIYSPLESDLGNDTLFFTLYNDVIEMLHANSIKIKSIDYTYNPESDAFVQFGKDIYFVCDVNMEIVSNYVNLGKLIQDIYQYPYYIKINDIDVKPYPKDKKILISSLSLRLYAHTAPEDNVTGDAGDDNNKLDNAKLPLPQ